jgi:hypothetical protein
LLNNVSDKCHAVNFFWGVGIAQISLLIKTRFRLALKVQSSNVRTDTDRAAGLLKDMGKYERQNESSPPDLSTTAAGVTNARRKPASVEPQQPI